MKCQRSSNRKCHLMANVIRCQMFLQLFTTFGIFGGNFWKLLPSFGNFWQHSPSVGNFFNPFCNFWYLFHFWGFFATFHNFWQILALQGYFFHLLVTFCNFLQLLLGLGNFCHVLVAFDAFCKFWQLWLFFATVAIFKHPWADFGIPLAYFGCSHKLLATFMNFLSLWPLFDNFFQFQPFLAILVNFQKFLATFAFPYYIVIKPSYQLVICQ